MSVLTPTLAEVLTALRGKRFRYNTERDLHEGLSAALDAGGVAHRREVVVPGGRIDFVVDRLGIEVKVKGSAVALERQVGKYALAEELDEFLIITTRRTHDAVPRTIGGKRVWVHTIGGLSL